MRRLPLSRADAMSLLLVMACVLAATLPVATSGDRIHLDDDFLQLAGRREDVRKGVVEYHTLTEWSPWFGGGYPTLGDPEHPTLNPLMALTLVLGTVRGIKWTGILMMVFAGVSLYLLCHRKLGFRRWPAIGTALFFALSPWTPVRMRDGNPTEIYYLLLPAVIWCLLAAGARKWCLFLAALLFFTALSDGKTILPVTLLYLAVLGAAAMVPGLGVSSGGEERAWSGVLLRRLGVAVALTFFLGLCRIAPAVELINQRASLLRMELASHGDSYYTTAYSPRMLLYEPVGWNGEDGLDGNRTSIYMGWLPVLLGVVGLALNPRRSAVWAIAALPMLWLAMGTRAPVDLFRVLWHLPLFNGISNTGKYFLPPALFSGCIVAGLGLEAVERRMPAGRYLAPLIVAAGVVVLGVKVWDVSATSYPDPVPTVAAEPVPGFYQVHGDGLDRGRANPPEANMYVNLLRGVGTIDWYTAVPLPEDAVAPRYFISESGQRRMNPAYRGEVYWDGAGQVQSFAFEPNRLTAHVVSDRPGELIFNQNYNRDWNTNVGEFHNYNGLVAVSLPAGEHEVDLTYFSSSFALGLLLSLLSAIAAGAIAYAYHTGRLERSGNLFSKTILWWLA